MDRAFCFFMDKKAIAEIKALFETAENYCKAVEASFSERGLVVPAINELRYCGKHLLDACTQEQADEELRRARAHCQRAIYDAAEAAALASLESFDTFRARFHKVPIGGVVAGYQAICEDFRALRKSVSERLDDEEKPNRYRALMDSAKKAMSHLETLDAMEEELKKRQAEKEALERERQSGQRNSRVTLWLQGIGLFLAGVGTAVTVLAFFK